MRWRAMAGLAALALLGLATAGSMPVRAWDTKEMGLGGDDKGKWISLYACRGGVGSGGVDCAHNEHEQLADMVLQRVIAGNSEWFIAGGTDLKVVDLNASLYRPSLRERPGWPRGQSGRPLEERLLADPPHWAGIPDFSYSIYDWINKNAYCPPLPLNRQNDPDCHVYKLYHGGIFNASHWATQDNLGYRRLHALAIREAGRAKALREALEAAGPTEVAAYRDAVREAELLAMAYEGYAQHFLQDRWAEGHMWNRWGAPDYHGYPYWNRPSQAAVVGAFVGIIHGAEAVVGRPDALSSPAPSLSALNPFSGGVGVSMGFSIGAINEMEWAFPNGEPSGGVGDYRLEDLMDGRFGSGYAAFSFYDWELNVSRQRAWLLRCSAGGWRQVIEALGRNRAGGYGLQRLQLTAEGDDGISRLCFEPLATNRSMRDGWGFRANTGNPGTASLEGWEMTLANLARAALAAFFVGDVRLRDLPEAVLDRVSLVRITNTLAMYGRFYPNGTEMAAGGMPDWGEAKTSDQYGLAAYFEPEDLDSLPDSSPNGRDKQALYGFFNRAHAGYFCQAAKEKRLFEDMRGRPEAAQRASCRYLADRLYAGTPISYTGPQKAVRRVAGADSAAVSPMCAIQPAAAERVAGEDWDREVPHYLHPGYVPFDASTGRSGAYDRDPMGYSSAAVGAWCDRRPVLDTLADEALAARDIVAEVTDLSKNILLKGEDLGERKGELRIGRTWGDSVVVKRVFQWNDNEIRFDLASQIDEIKFNGDDEAFIFVVRGQSRNAAAPGADRSVGRFVIRKALPSPKIIKVTARAGGELVYSDQPAPPTPITDVPPGEDPPAWTPPGPGAFRPVGPGKELEVEITFDEPMDREAEEQAFKLGGFPLEGRWTGSKTWKGKLRTPDDETYRTSWRGYRALDVSAKARSGAWYDADEAASGVQTDTGHALLIDVLPLYVERVRVKGGGGLIYDGGWSEGPDYAKAANWVAGIWKAAERRLRLAVAKAPPASGRGEIRVDLSADAKTAPRVQVGGALAVMKGKGRTWTGSFDYAAARTQMQGPDIPIQISVEDAVARDFDADPRSPTLVQPKDRVGYGTLWWTSNESALGGSTTAEGGPDRRHRLGAPPELSLMVILDKSGSMEGDRIRFARSGVEKAFARLPKGRSIEMAAIAFDGCGDPQVMPFTRDLDAVRQFLLNAQPGGGTALARAHEVAADLFASAASPASAKWRYVTFSDGLESCDGDTAAAIARLQKVIGSRQIDKPANRPEPKPKPEPPAYDCRPQSWRVYETRVQDVRVLPAIRLLEHWYFERQLADGRCLLRLETKEYGVFYGASGANRKWGVNSKPSKTSVEFASSQNGAANADRVRRLAGDARGSGSDLPAARKKIAEAVGAALDRLADSSAAKWLAAADSRMAWLTRLTLGLFGRDDGSRA